MVECTKVSSMEEVHFSSLSEWREFMIGKVFEEPSILTLHQTYQEWLAENPRGFV
jgi:hypothetical protein